MTAVTVAAAVTAVTAAFTPERLKAVLSTGHETPDQPGPSAAVAAIMRKGDRGPEVLFIERATHHNDPWSGHMAFPGGRAEPGDENSFSTAARETAEELGIDIVDNAHHLGRLSDLQGGPRGTGMRLRVTPHICWWLGKRPQPKLNHEVAAALWVRLADLVDRKRFVRYHYPRHSGTTWPGIELDDGRVVWGLTLRMLEDLFCRIRLPLNV